VLICGQLPFFLATIRATSGYEMKSELLTRRLSDWCEVRLRPHVSLSLSLDT
jgi:hypothetical protein